MQFDSAPPTGLDHQKWKTRIYEIETTEGMLPCDPRSKEERQRITTEVTEYEEFAEDVRKFAKRYS